MTTVTLSKPVALGLQLISELHLKPIKFGDWPQLLKAMSLTDLEDVVRLVAQLADVPQEVASNIHGDDVVPVLNAVAEHVANYAPKTH